MAPRSLVMTFVTGGLVVAGCAHQPSSAELSSSGVTLSPAPISLSVRSQNAETAPLEPRALMLAQSEFEARGHIVTPDGPTRIEIELGPLVSSIGESGPQVCQRYVGRTLRADQPAFLGRLNEVTRCHPLSQETNSGTESGATGVISNAMALIKLMTADRSALAEVLLHRGLALLTEELSRGARVSTAANTRHP